jgi:hypothetical protein
MAVPAGRVAVAARALGCARVRERRAMADPYGTPGCHRDRSRSLALAIPAPTRERVAGRRMPVGRTVFFASEISEASQVRVNGEESSLFHPAFRLGMALYDADSAIPN